MNTGNLKNHSEAKCSFKINFIADTIFLIKAKMHLPEKVFFFAQDACCLLTGWICDVQICNMMVFGHHSSNQQAATIYAKQIKWTPLQASAFVALIKIPYTHIHEHLVHVNHSILTIFLLKKIIRRYHSFTWDKPIIQVNTLLSGILSTRTFR